MAPRTFQLLSSGSNGQGQLGIGHVDDVSLYTPCRFQNAAASSSQRSVEIGRVTSLASGSGHSLLLAEDSEGKLGIWATGSNEYGQLGPSFPSSRDSPTTSWTSVDAGGLLTAAGLCDDETTRYEPKLVACSWTTSFICFSRWRRRQSEWERASDVVLSFGTNDFGELGRTAAEGKGKERENGGRVGLVHFPWVEGEDGSWVEVVQLKASQRHVVAVTRRHAASGVREDSRVWGWGASRHGQIDARSGKVFRPSGPVNGSGKHGDDAKDEKTIKGDVNGPNIAPRKSSSPSKARRPLSNPKASSDPPPLAKLKSRRPDNPYPRSQPVPVEIDLSSLLKPDQSWSVADLSLGATHTVLLIDVETQSTSERIVIGLGNGSKGQLDFEPPDTPTTLGCTWNGTYMSAGKEIWVTGSNTHGQLGVGRAEEAVAMEKVDIDRGNVEKLVCGSEHILLLVGRELWTWGWNEHGNLGLGDAEDRWEPVKVPIGGQGTVVDAWAGCGSSWILLST